MKRLKVRFKIVYEGYITAPDNATDEDIFDLTADIELRKAHCVGQDEDVEVLDETQCEPDGPDACDVYKRVRDEKLGL